MDRLARGPEQSCSDRRYLSPSQGGPPTDGATRGERERERAGMNGYNMEGMARKRMVEVCLEWLVRRRRVD